MPDDAMTPAKPPPDDGPPEDGIDDEIEEEDEQLPFKYAITSYGADYPVDGLVKRLKRGDVFIPSFQRKFVWPMPKASRFVESLLLGLPVPGIFLSREKETNKLLVIDGQQRLLTLQYFYEGVFSDSRRQFRLTGIASRFIDATYDTLGEDDRRRLDDSIIHATVVRQDEPSDDDSSIYMIFERLNTGGVQLSAQEIRACIYHGHFNELLRRLNNHEQWRNIYGKPHKRLRDQELILRFLALAYRGDDYAEPMKGFLNEFMGQYRCLSDDNSTRFARAFERTINCIYECLGKRAFRPVRVVNAAVFDAVMVGVERRLRQGDITDLANLGTAYHELLKDDDFEEATERSTTSSGNVRKRIEVAIEYFSKVK